MTETGARFNSFPANFTELLKSEVYSVCKHCRCNTHHLCVVPHLLGCSGTGFGLLKMLKLQFVQLETACNKWLTESWLHPGNP